MARKRLNKKLVIVVTLFTFATMVGLAAVMLRQLQQRDPQYFVELAKRYESEEQWKSAAAFYKKAWDRSRDATHLVKLGDAMLNTGEVEKAVAIWREALVNAPGLTEAYLRQLELFFEMAELNGRTRQWNLLKETAEAFLNSNAERTDVQAAFAHNAHGLALTSLANQDEGNALKGEAELRRAIDLAPDHVGYAIDLAQYLTIQNRLDEGQQLFGELQRQYATPGVQAAQVRLALAQLRATQNKEEEAEEYFKQSIVFAEADREALRDAQLGYARFLANQWQQRSRGSAEESSANALFEEAETILKGRMEVDADDYEPYVALASLYRLANRHADVVTVCESRLERGFSRKGVAATRNRLSAFQLMIQASRASVAKAVEAKEDEDATTRDAWFQKAEAFLASARGEFPSHPRVPAQAGRIKLARGLDREALEDLRMADERYRTVGAIDWENKLTLARVHLGLKEAGAAVNVLDEAIGSVGNLPAADAQQIVTLFAQALFANNEPNRALGIAEGLLSSNPENAQALRVKAAILEQQGRLAEAGKIIETTGDPVIAAILTAEQHALEGNLQIAEEVLRTSLQDNPDNQRLVRATVRILMRLDRPEDARAVVRSALESSPDNVRLQTLEVLVKADLSKEDRDQAILDIIATQEDPYQRAVEYVGFYIRGKEHEKCLTAIDDALGHITAKDTPAARNATVHQHRALLTAKLSVASATKDTAALDSARDAATRFNVDGAGGKSMLGLYHMHKKDYALAIRAFREAIDIQPTDAQSLTHLGQCLYETGQKREAQGFFERAIRVNPNDGIAHKNLAIVAKERGDTSAYQASFLRCAKLIPSDPWVQGELLTQRESANPEEAIARRRSLLEKKPEDIANLIKLIHLCEKAQEIAEADGYCDRLLELRPDDDKMVGAVGNYYMRTKRPERSLSVLTSFAESRHTNEQRADARILVAAWYQQQNRPEDVERTLLEAAGLSETLPVQKGLAEFYLSSAGDPVKALVWLDKAVEQARSSNTAELPDAMARRIACLLHPKVSDLAKAGQAVDELLRTVPNDPKGLLLLSEVKTRSGDIGRAIDALTEYLRQEPQDNRSRYRRALHYCAQGRPQEAIEDLLIIRRNAPRALNLEPRELLARLYKESGRADEWIRELESAVQDTPGYDVALDSLVRAYSQQNRMNDAKRLVTARINRAEGSDAVQWLSRRSRISRKLGDAQGALADVRQASSLLGHSADGVRMVLAMCASLGRESEGIAFYQQHATEEQTNPALRSQFAKLLGKSGETGQAVAEFRKAMALAMVSKQSYVRGIATDLRAAFPSDDAIQLFEADPPGGDLSRANERILVALYRMAKQNDKAIARLESLIAGAVDDAERTQLFRELGDVHQVADHADQAVVAYEESIKYDANNWIALNNLAYLVSDTFEEHDRARIHAARAVAVSPSFATLDTLGWIDVGLGDLRLAAANLNRAIRLDPGQGLPYYHLGEAYRRESRWVDAENVLRRGSELAQSRNDEELLNLIHSSLERISASDSQP